MKSYTELEGEQGCRVPLSIGTPVEATHWVDKVPSHQRFYASVLCEDFDKKGEPCVSYDVVANPEVCLRCRMMWVTNQLLFFGCSEVPPF